MWLSSKSVAIWLAYVHAIAPLPGICACGMVLVLVAFFSVKPLEFCGLQDPIHTLTGTRYVYWSETIIK